MKLDGMELVVNLCGVLARVFGLFVCVVRTLRCTQKSNARGTKSESVGTKSEPKGIKNQLKRSPK